MNDMTVCKACDGSGYYDIYYSEFNIYEQECEECDGTGEIED